MKGARRVQNNKNNDNKIEDKRLKVPLALKELSPIFSTFFSNFWRFRYHKKSHIFLITHSKFYNWEVFRLEDINENVWLW